MEWSIRSILNPVITRLLIYGVNPIDLEFVISKIENKKLLISESLENSWFEEWEKKAKKYIELGEISKNTNNKKSAEMFYCYAAQCYYAIFLINQSKIEKKKYVYQMYSKYYRKFIKFGEHDIEQVDIKIEDNTITGYLYHSGNKMLQQQCVVIYSGLGSCKEELHTIAMPVVERGISVFIVDMPGCGETLFKWDTKCSINNINLSFSRILDVLQNEYNFNKFGAYGLCMGGGYAFRAACSDDRYNLCVNLFPLFITRVDSNCIPMWLKKGEWYNYQTGNKKYDNFFNEMKELENGKMEISYFLIHGRNDNWMLLDNIMDFYDKVRGKKRKLIIDDEAVFSNDFVITHTMPVGEQLHWIKYIIADWIAEEFGKICENKKYE